MTSALSSSFHAAFQGGQQLPRRPDLGLPLIWQQLRGQSGENPDLLDYWTTGLSLLNLLHKNSELLLIGEDNLSSSLFQLKVGTVTGCCFLPFSLPNVLRATPACTVRHLSFHSAPELRCFGILASKCVSHHICVHFFNIPTSALRMLPRVRLALCATTTYTFATSQLPKVL